MNGTIGFTLYACLKGSIIARQQVNVVATFGIINGQVVRIIQNIIALPWYISHIPQHGAFDLHHRCGIYNIQLSITHYS